MVVMGIDPGASGGVAWIRDGGSTAVPMPDTERDLLDFLSDGIEEETRFAYLEKVHSMPRQGVASTFKFGVNYGMLRGMLIALRIPFDDVTPQKWQKEMGCLTRGDKNVSKARAQQLFPQLKVTHAIADALLIAEFGPHAG